MTDDRMDRLMGNLLRAGVIFAAAIVLAGGIWYLLDSGGRRPVYRPFHPEIHGLHALVTLPRPEAVILLGLLFLIATPVARVVFSLVAFATAKDRLYTGFTLAVLLILLYSLGTSWL